MQFRFAPSWVFLFHEHFLYFNKMLLSSDSIVHTFTKKLPVVSPKRSHAKASTIASLNQFSFRKLFMRSIPCRIFYHAWRFLLSPSQTLYPCRSVMPRPCFRASRIRISINHAVFCVTPTCSAREIEEIPFLEGVRRKIEINHFC